MNAYNKGKKEKAKIRLLNSLRSANKALGEFNSILKNISSKLTSDKQKAA